MGLVRSVRSEPTKGLCPGLDRIAPLRGKWNLLWCTDRRHVAGTAMHSSNRRPDCQVGPEGRACLAPALFRAVPAFLAARAVLLRRWPCQDRKSTRLNQSLMRISYAVFCLKKKKKHHQ